jgi:hypothetical protein
MPLAVAIGLGLITILPTANATVALQPTVAASPPIQSAPGEALRWTLTPAELEAIVARYRMDVGYSLDGRLDEITVTAPAETLPVHEPTREIWRGLAAPVWAVLHPTQAWRILLPIPPE